MNIYLQFISFLHTDKTQVVEIFPHEILPPYLFYTFNNTSADVLATQGTRVSANHDTDYVEPE